MQQYREYALLCGACDVIQCGTIKHPGISDIDCVLVIKDWAETTWPARLFNPEIFSSLFTHGPFVVSARELNDLFRFTTLRPMYPRSRNSFEVDADRRRVVIAARQSLSWAHLWNVVENRAYRDARSSLLLLKSVSYSLQEILAFSSTPDISQKAVSEFSNSVENLRSKYLIQPNHRGQEIEALYLNAQKLLDRLGNDMALWIAESTTIHVGDNRAIAYYSALLTSDERTFRFHRSTHEEEACCMRRFFRALMHGHRLSGAGWKGAEFPFHAHYDLTLGWRIWPRRIIKRVFVPAYRRILLACDEDC
jgi:hypothetical protein